MRQGGKGAALCTSLDTNAVFSTIVHFLLGCTDRATYCSIPAASKEEGHHARRIMHAAVTAANSDLGSWHHRGLRHRKARTELAFAS